MIIINPLTARVVGAPQMILQPVFSIFPCFPLPSGTWRTPSLSIPWCCLSTSSSVCLVFFHLSLCLARWFWPDLMYEKHDHTTAVCVSLRSSGLRVVRCLLDLGTDFLVGNMVFVWDVSCGGTSFPWIVFFSGALLWGSMIHKRTGRWMWQGNASVVSC